MAEKTKKYEDNINVTLTRKEILTIENVLISEKINVQLNKYTTLNEKNQIVSLYNSIIDKMKYSSKQEGL